ncbi:VOC family protein [Sciscionella sediminilitoris]|uniref:VOC family protein n=1 Tax=Sciscionella sediminilitoris TaxID=1445613 RepID=UPI0004DF2F6D|nr:VOC family protein [Sciscionella sp. SE31]
MATGKPHSQSVIPRVFVREPAAFIAFLRDIFGAQGEFHDGRPSGVVIGDSTIMVSGIEERGEFPAFLYIYVENADTAFQRALDTGAESLEEPADMFYGDRRAMIRDPFGNIFQIAHRMT